ncbi:hypothetical protein HHI36_011585 [Cryptolaemus montrouzieri]|uniref:Uncharacterized protein n=1 Tax=Cryptolaemus montrouzieri TaxID=559131 RepID=A0ABD2MMG0_9CUCU
MKWDNIKSINSHIYSEMCIEYIKFLQRDNASMASMKSFLANYLDDIIKSQNKFKAVKNNAELEKFLINLLINKIQSICKDEDEKTHFCFALFEEILDWNSRHPEDPFDFLGISEIKESIKLKMKKGFGYNDSAEFYFHKFIKGEITCKDAQFQNEIEIIFWENFSEKYNNTIVEYYLRKNPTRILENFDTFIEVISEKWDSLCIWRFLKHYDHLQLPEKIIAYLKANKMIDFISMNTVIALATLMDPDEYMEYLPTPQNEKLDVDNGGESDNYKLASKFLTYAKYLNSNSVLPRIVDFCKGDYLHEALTPLYFYFFHSAEKHLLVELQNLSTRAVSVRKHAVKLACSVSTREIVFMLIKQMTDDEKNSSAKEHLFRKTFKYFLVDQSEELYSLVQIQLNALDILESPAFKDTCTLRNLPEKYKLLFLKFIWNILDESENKGNDVSELRGKLVESLTTEIIHDLPYEFCSNLIKAKFLQFESVHKIPINNFVLNCIKHSKQKELILQDVFQVMSDFKKNYILHQDFNISQKVILILNLLFQIFL